MTSIVPPIDLMGTFDDLSDWIINYQIFTYEQVFPDEVLKREYPIIDRVAFSKMVLNHLAFHGMIHVYSDLPVLILISLFRYMNIHLSNHFSRRGETGNKMHHSFRVTMMIDDFETMAVMTKLSA